MSSLSCQFPVLLLFSLAVVLLLPTPFEAVPIETETIKSAVGETVRLDCPQDQRTTEIGWWKENSRINTTKRIYWRKNGKVLKLKSLRNSDFGRYQCMKLETNELLKGFLILKKEPDNSALLKPVFIDPLKMKRSSYNVQPAQGNLRLPCSAKSSVLPIKYTWFKNSKIFTGRRLDHRLVYNTSVLRLKELVPSDVGNYTCIASNRYGSISFRFQVKVLEKIMARPYLQKDNIDNATAYLGTNVSLSCFELISGTLPDFRWVHWKVFPTKELIDSTIKSGQFVNESIASMMDPVFYKPINKHIQDTPRYGVKLQLYNVSLEDSGWYSCIVSNHIGHDYLVATLRVTPPPGPTVGSAISKSTPTISLEDLIVILVVTMVVVTLIVCFIGIACKSNISSLFRKPKSTEDNKNGSSVKISNRTTNESLSGKDSKPSRMQRISSSTGASNEPLRRGLSIQSALENSRSNSYPSHFFSSPIDIREKFPNHYDESWEIEREALHLGEILGEGAFGVVVKAEAFGLPNMPYQSTVAVKKLRGNATDNDIDDLLCEMETMRHIGQHLNIISFLGYSTLSGELLVVVEYAPHGNLRQFLRSRRPTAEMLVRNETAPLLSLTDLISASLQISKGMQYLVFKKCIHRDLAARNVLVGEDYVMKIADFGLARNVRDTDYYKKTTDGRLPVKWLAIEALFDRVYTTQSDVWAFGVLLWEIFTLGGSPYPGVPVEKLFDLLKKGFRMEKPQGCPLEIYQMMCRCWFEDPNSRPSFDELVDELGKLLEQLASSAYVKVLAQSLSTIAESECASSDSIGNEEEAKASEALLPPPEPCQLSLSSRDNADAEKETLLPRQCNDDVTELIESVC